MATLELRESICGAAQRLRQPQLTFAGGRAASFKANKVVETTPNNPNKGKAIVPQVEIIWTSDPEANPN